MTAGTLVLVAVVCSVKNKNWNKVQRALFPILSIYICFVLGITIFYRLPYDSVKYNMELFWSYRAAAGNRKLMWEILLNYFMLLPFGILGSFYLRRRWVILLGLSLSVAIELTQFFMRRGLLEFDDMLGNTLGVLIGVGIFSLMRYIGEKCRNGK